jgi:hypothetical protein
MVALPGDPRNGIPIDHSNRKYASMRRTAGLHRRQDG